MKITWFGTASILIEAAGERILFDPFVQPKGGENPICLEDFIREDTVCITHGHLDHLMYAAEFLDSEGPGDATIYCGSAAAKTLSDIADDTGSVVCVKPGMSWRAGDVQLTVWEGKHARYGARDKRRILSSLRTIKYFRNALALAFLHRRFPEGGQTYLYELHAEGKRVLVMGSLGLKEGISYPEGADLLILPFQGCDYPEEEALSIVERLRPKRILLDHFDDAFPPVSCTMDTRSFKKLMDEQFPHIPVAKPTAFKPVALL